MSSSLRRRHVMSSVACSRCLRRRHSCSPANRLRYPRSLRRAQSAGRRRRDCNKSPKVNVGGNTRRTADSSLRWPSTSSAERGCREGRPTGPSFGAFRGSIWRKSSTEAACSSGTPTSTPTALQPPVATWNGFEGSSPRRSKKTRRRGGRWSHSKERLSVFVAGLLFTQRQHWTSSHVPLQSW